MAFQENLNAFFINVFVFFFLFEARDHGVSCRVLSGLRLV